MPDGPAGPSGWSIGVRRGAASGAPGATAGAPGAAGAPPGAAGAGSGFGSSSAGRRWIRCARRSRTRSERTPGSRRSGASSDWANTGPARSMRTRPQLPDTPPTRHALTTHRPPLVAPRERGAGCRPGRLKSRQCVAHSPRRPQLPFRSRPRRRVPRPPEPAVSATGRFIYTGAMANGWPDSERLRHVFEQTEIVRKPLTGIVTGYHVLPYVLVAPERAGCSVEVCGRIRVSPRLVLGVGGGGPTYGDVFAERELMDVAVVARVFSFRYAPRLMLESEDLQIRRHERAAAEHLERVLDDLA